MRSAAIAGGLAFLLSALPACQRPADQGMTVPVDYYKLDNGLRVVLSHDATAPTVVVAVYYNIGFRTEPKGRTGFAHLFEHMMFQGSANLGKMEFIRLVQSNGGILNGSTRFDYTNYYQVVPSHKLETMLWAEADRMRSLDITQDNLTNQQGVVSNEVKVNVLNQPYGGFPWLDLPQAANTNWHNAHNFYGDLEDLAAATLDDVKDFFKTYYTPNNAVLVVTGDFETTGAKELIAKYFGDIPAGPQPARPDLTEPRQEQARRVEKADPLASRPAIAFGYHMPDRGTPAYYAMGLLDQILLQGDDSMLREALVQQRGWTSEVTGGINADLGTMFDYSGPMLWSFSFVHDASLSDAQITAVVDSLMLHVASTPMSAEQVDKARIKARSSFYSLLGSYFGVGKAGLLAVSALFDDRPEMVNDIEARMAAVTPEHISAAARDYLRKTNQTALVVVPGSGK